MRLRMIVTFLLTCAPGILFAQPAHLVKDIFNLPAAAGSNPQKFAQVGSTVFFAASDTANGTELWKTDGTPGGTMLVRDILVGPFGSQPDCLQPYQGR
jgi:ELWxxDGT repeat protein